MEGEPVVIAVVNHKGGTAKTTTAVNLAAALAKGDSEMGIRPRRVLLVDLDPRGNVACHIIMFVQARGTSYANIIQRHSVLLC